MPIQYADLPRPAVTQADLEAWREELAGVPSLTLAADRARPSRAFGLAGARVLEIDRSRVAGLQVLASRHRASLFMALLASFEVLLMRHNEGDDFVVGCPVAGRHSELTERMIAPLPVRRHHRRFTYPSATKSNYLVQRCIAHSVQNCSVVHERRIRRDI